MDRRFAVRYQELMADAEVKPRPACERTVAGRFNLNDGDRGRDGVGLLAAREGDRDFGRQCGRDLGEQRKHHQTNPSGQGGPSEALAYHRQELHFPLTVSTSARK